MLVTIASWAGCRSNINMDHEIYQPDSVISLQPGDLVDQYFESWLPNNWWSGL